MTLEQHYAQLLQLGEGWAVQCVELDWAARSVVIRIGWDVHLDGHCSQCGEKAPFHDVQPERDWRHLDTMQFATVLRGDPPRCRCPQCGVRTMRLDWAAPHGRFTLLFEALAVAVLQHAGSIKAACRMLRIGWESAHRLMERAVERGAQRRRDTQAAQTAQGAETTGMEYLGVDEKAWQRGHCYASILTDLTTGHVMEVEEGRDKEAARALLEKAIPEERRGCVAGICMDFLEAYAAAATEILPQADIIHDRFHVSGYLGKAVDQVRRSEHRQRTARGDHSLKGQKYLFLRNPEGWTCAQHETFAQLQARSCRVARAWQYKELFRSFWGCRSVQAARAFFGEWWRRARRSGLQPVKDVAASLKRHLTGLLNYMEHPLTNAASEGNNSSIQSLIHRSRGYRSFRNFRISILFHRGGLDLSPLAQQPAH